MSIDSNLCDQCKLCRNKGLCYLTPFNKVMCYCVPGYAGTYCQTDINECLSSPCLNNSTCVDHVNAFECKCKSGYKGETCEQIYNPCDLNPCKHSTLCTVLMNGDYRCDCLDSGYEGYNCEIEVDDCKRNLCKNNSTCIDGFKSYKCQCKYGYTGQFCEIPLNPCYSLPCMNNSTCSSIGSLYACHCNIGYTGSNCNIKIKPCEKNPCGFHGTCIDIEDTFKCFCSAGFTGDRCLQNLNECETESNLCQFNSSCIDLDPSSNKRKLGYTCDCSTIKHGKYAGQNCSIKLDICSTNGFGSDACLNNSTCVPFLSDHNEQDFYCRCRPGFAGKFCELNTLITLDSKYYLEYQLSSRSVSSPLIKSYDGYENKNDVIIKLLNENKESNPLDDSFKLKFDFKIKLFEHKNYQSPLCVLRLQNNQAIEIKINRYFIEVYLNSLLIEELPFLSKFSNDTNWHSIEVFIKMNAIEVTYKVQGYSFNKRSAIKSSIGAMLPLASQSQLFNNNLQLASFSIGKSLLDSNTNGYMEACIRDVKLNDNYAFLNDSNIQYGCIKSSPDCAAVRKSPLVIPNFQRDCENNAVCTSKLFDNECVNCVEPYYGKNCEYKSNDIRFDQSRMSNLTIKLENIEKNNANPRGFEVSFNFKPNFYLMRSTLKNEKIFISEVVKTDLENEAAFLCLLNSQTSEVLKLSLTFLDHKSNDLGTESEEAHLNVRLNNTQSNFVNLKNFIRKSLISNKFYKLTVQIKDNQISFKIDELNLRVNLDYAFNSTNFDTVIILNKFFGVINSIKINNNKNIINYNQNLNEEKQVFKLFNSNEYVIVEQGKCLFEK